VKVVGGKKVHPLKHTGIVEAATVLQQVRDRGETQGWPAFTSQVG